MANRKLPLAGVEPREAWTEAAGRPVRSLVLGAPRPGVPPLVIVPGLGALGYLRRLQRTCASWTSVTLLDVPGFGDRRTAGSSVDLDASAGVVAASLPERAVLFGHSTGAQIALRVAVAQPGRVAALVLGGPTFEPATRTLWRVAWQLARTGLHESPTALAANMPYYLRGLPRLLAFVRNGIADRPEDSMPLLPMPVLVISGRHDALAPARWVEQLAALAPRGAARAVPGAHSFPHTYAEQTGALIAAVAREAST